MSAVDEPVIYVLAQSQDHARSWADRQDPPLYSGQYRFLSSPRTGGTVSLLDGDRVVYVGNWEGGPWGDDVHNFLIENMVASRASIKIEHAP